MALMDERELVDTALAQLSSGAGSEPTRWPPVGRRIKEARERAGLSESDIAARLGMTASEYWDIELHDDEAFSVFAIAELAHLAELLGVSLEVLLFGADVEVVPGRTPYRVIAERLATVIASEGVTIETMSDRVGWDLAPVLRDPEALGQFNVVGLRDVCRAIDIDWVSALPRPK